MAVRVPFRLRKLAWLVSASLAATGTAVAAPAARVDFAIGGVTVTGADGRSRPAVKGLELESGDRIVTAEGRAQLRFTDGAYVSVQPNSDFSIREYRFDGKTDGTEKGIFGLVRGALRTVTGAIGRVNRGAYQIQTPTATIGIRGTGGLIQVLPDGSTLITGNSGVWSLGNQAGSVDVPAGKAAKAGPNPMIPPSESVEGPVLPPPQGPLETPLWPTESDALTALPTSAPNAGPLFVPGPETVLVAGNNVTSNGLPASLFGPINCSGGCEIAHARLDPNVNVGTTPAPTTTVTLDGSGRMLGFSSGGMTATLTGTFSEFGSFDGVIAWGRWVGSADLNGAPWPGFKTLAYVVGPPTPFIDIASMSGTFTFNLVGATAPTDTMNNVGVVTGGQVIGQFGPSPKAGIQNFQFSIAGANYTMNSGGPVMTINPLGGQFSPFSGNVSTTATSGPCSGATSCFANVQGHFHGTGATHAGFAYGVNGIVGTAAFKR